MTHADFIAVHQRLGISRAALCRALGLSPNAGTRYASGEVPIPHYIELACRELERQQKEKNASE